jgi:cytochrome b561
LWLRRGGSIPPIPRGNSALLNQSTMQKIAEEMAFIVLIMMTLGVAVLGVLHYQEGKDAGMVVAIISLIVFYLLLLIPKDN